MQNKKTLYVRSCPVSSIGVLEKIAKDLDCSLADAFYHAMSYLEDSKVKFKKEIKTSKKS